MYILLVLQNVHTSGFAKCTYFWISNKYILLLSVRPKRAFAASAEAEASAEAYAEASAEA